MTPVTRNWLKSALSDDQPVHGKAKKRGVHRCWDGRDTGVLWMLLFASLSQHLHDGRRPTSGPFLYQPPHLRLPAQFSEQTRGSTHNNTPPRNFRTLTHHVVKGTHVITSTAHSQRSKTGDGDGANSIPRLPCSSRNADP